MGIVKTERLSPVKHTCIIIQGKIVLWIHNEKYAGFCCLVYIYIIRPEHEISVIIAYLSSLS